MWDFLLGVLLIYIVLRLFFTRQDEGMRGKIKVSHVHTDKDIIVFKIEEINGVYYLWDKDSDDFLAQGTTIEKAIDVMMDRYPNKIFKNSDLVIK
jgi:hypothetical protein